MILINQLIGLLEQNSNLYGEMISKVEEENLAIQRCDLDRLNELVKEKENISLKLKMVDESRKNLLVKIASETGKAANEITIGELAEMPENASVRGRLLAVKERLLGDAAATKERNDFNRRLIGRAMNTIKESLRYANNLVGGPGNTYSNGKHVEGRMPSGMVVTRSY